MMQTVVASLLGPSALAVLVQLCACQPASVASDAAGSDHGAGPHVDAGSDAATATDSGSQPRDGAATADSATAADAAQLDRAAPVDTGGAADLWSPPQDAAAGQDRRDAAVPPVDSGPGADTAPIDPCYGITCSGHGTCEVVGGSAQCNCGAGYVPLNLACVPENPDAACEGITCDGHGTCLADGDTPRCHCDPGFVNRAVATTCVDVTGTVCEGVDCGPYGTCFINVSVFTYASCSCDPGYVSYGMACVPESRLFCRDQQNNRVGLGSTRCGGDDTIIEVCRDADGDGAAEWAYGVDCNPGTLCSQGCRTAICPDQPCPLGTACVEEAHEEPLGVCVPTCDCSNCDNCSASDPGWGDWQQYCGNGDASPATVACNIPCANAGDGCIPYNPQICWPMEGCFSAAPVE